MFWTSSHVIGRLPTACAEAVGATPATRTMATKGATEVVDKAATALSGDAGVVAQADQENLEVIDLARVAVGRATSGATRLWARQMIDDHGRNDRDLRSLTQRLKLPSLPPLSAT